MSRPIPASFMLLVAPFLAITALAQTPEAPVAPGPKVGEKVPAFSMIDQFGKERSLASLAGREGLILLFVRSADW